MKNCYELDENDKRETSVVTSSTYVEDTVKTWTQNSLHVTEKPLDLRRTIAQSF